MKENETTKKIIIMEDIKSFIQETNLKEFIFAFVFFISLHIKNDVNK